MALATDYRDTIPGAKLVYFPDTRHQLFDEQSWRGLSCPGVSTRPRSNAATTTGIPSTTIVSSTRRKPTGFGSGTMTRTAA